MPTLTLPNLPVAAMPALAALAIEPDEDLALVERRVRAKLKTLDRQARHDGGGFLRGIERLIEAEREGGPALPDDQLTAMIDEALASENGLKAYLRSTDRAYAGMAKLAARAGAGRRDIVLLAGREFAQAVRHYIAGFQEGRWMLMGLRDGREPGGSGTVVATPEALRRALDLD